MMRAILKMFFWFVYDIFMIGVAFVCATINIITQMQLFNGLAIAAMIFALIGAYKIWNTK